MSLILHKHVLNRGLPDFDIFKFKGTKQRYVYIDSGGVLDREWLYLNSLALLSIKCEAVMG